MCGFGAGALIIAPIATRLVVAVGVTHTFADLGVTFLVALAHAAC